jgi:hypothetical protein
VKLLLAALSVTAVCAMAGRSMMPSVPLVTFLFWCAAFLVAIVVLSFIGLQLGQWALERGGKDPMWFWFDSDPPGLRATGEQKDLKDAERKSDQSGRASSKSKGAKSIDPIP